MKKFTQIVLSMQTIISVGPDIRKEIQHGKATCKNQYNQSDYINKKSIDIIIVMTLVYYCIIFSINTESILSIGQKRLFVTNRNKMLFKQHQRPINTSTSRDSMITCYISILQIQDQIQRRKCFINSLPSSYLCKMYSCIFCFTQIIKLSLYQ